jgi:tryptophanyl-tRNA synthetase
MSLTDPTKKMSKSDPKPKSRILITDSKDVIHTKLKTALTDSIEGITYDRERRPGVSNLVELMWHCDNSGASSPEELANDLSSLSMRALKEQAAGTIEEQVREIRGRYEELMGGDQKVLVDIAEDGARKAEEIAEETMKRVRAVVGMQW